MFFDASSNEWFSWGESGTPSTKKSGIHCFEKLVCNKLQIDEELYLNSNSIQSLVVDITGHDIFTQSVTNILNNQLVDGDVITQLADKIVENLCNRGDSRTLERLEKRIAEFRLSRFGEVATESNEDAD